MTANTPRSIRFDHTVASRLRAFVAVHPGWTGSSVANRLVDEGLRMDEHPGVLFREGPSGRRAVLVGGPDVWEVIRAIRSARSAEAELSADEVVQLVADNAGLPVRLVRTAVAYWGAYAEEIDDQVAAADRAEVESEQAWNRVHGLLAP